MKSSLEDAIETLHTAQDTISKPIHKRFIIGGATLYSESLRRSNPPLVDRILLTRILRPPFDDCDVFFPEFREGYGLWKQAQHDELQEWVGFEVPAGIQEEKGIQYEFQMWVRLNE